jgi:putative ABC transport system substrate-binding protein
VAVLVNPANPAARAFVREVERTAGAIGIKVVPFEAQNLKELENVFREAARRKADALLVSTTEGFFFSQRRLIAEHALRNRLPLVFAAPADYVEAGALLGYGSSSVAMFREAARYVDRILKGAGPGDLPVERPTKFELVINRRTADALGLTIPPTLLLQADQVIE